MQELFPADIVLRPQLPCQPHGRAKVEQALPPRTRAVEDLQRCLDALLNLPFLHTCQAPLRYNHVMPTAIMVALADNRFKGLSHALVQEDAGMQINEQEAAMHAHGTL